VGQDPEGPRLHEGAKSGEELAEGDGEHRRSGENRSVFPSYRYTVSHTGWD
jgi:hypothetical protein